MAWQVFTGGRLQLDGPGISISTGGKIHINKAAVEGLLESGPMDFVELLFNPEVNKIAIRPSEPERPGALSVYFPHGGATGATVSCVRFLNHIGYDWSKTRIFRAQFGSIEEIDVLLIDLPWQTLGHQPISRGKQRSKKQKGDTEVSP